MGFGISLILIALGAILAWAVNADVSGINIHTIGWILMIVGIVGFLLSFAWLDSMPWRSRRRYPATTDICRALEMGAGLVDPHSTPTGL
jgi:hypothetical protein